jgi:hypothetical protein
LKRSSLLFLLPIAFSATAMGDVFQILPDRASQNPTDIIDWTQLGPSALFTGSTIPTPQLVTTFNGNLVLVGNINGGDFLRLDEGFGWTGNFDFGESLVATGNPNFGFGGGGPFAMEFATPIASFGFNIQADLYGPFTAGVEVFDPFFSSLGLFTFNGVSAGGENGSALFVGLTDLTAVNIGAIVISTDSGDPLWNNDFAINDPSFGTPEPASMVLIGTVMALGAMLFRRKLWKAPVQEVQAR